MANTPHPTQPPPRPAAPAQHQPAAKHDPNAPAQAEPKPDPNQVKTVADEQRERSAEMEKAGGAEKWMAAQDKRTDEEKRQRPVAGVANVKTTQEDRARG